MKKTTKIDLLKSNDKRILWLVAAVCAFVASFGKISGFPSSVNVVVGVISGMNFIPAFIGSVISYIIQGSWENGIVQLCSILVIGVVRTVISDRSKTESPVFLGLLTSGVLILFGAVMSIAVSIDIYIVSMRMITALVSGCIVFILKTVLMRRDNYGTVELSGLNGVYGGVIFITATATLSAFPMPVVNLGRMLGCFAILCGVRKYRHAGGAVMGAMTTCGVLLCDPMLAKNTLLLATSGLICGAFIQFGVLAAVLSFIGISLISLVAIGINGDTFYMFADMIAGSILFIAVPVSFIKQVSGRVIGARNSVDIVGQTASSRLSFASKTLSDIRSQLSLISSAMERKNKDRDLKRQVCTAVCGECPMFANCWKANEDILYDAFSKLEDTVVRYNCISSADVRRELKMCIKQHEIEYVFNQLHKDDLYERANSIHIKEMRELLSEQLASVEDILGDLSYRVGQVRAIDTALSAQVRDYFDRLGYPNAKACVYIDENHTQRVEIFLTADYVGDILHLTTKISSIAECDFALPLITKSDGVTKITFTKQPEFSVDIGVFQTSSEKDELSGDFFDTARLSPNEEYLILSDGMGTGKRARLDSMFTVNLLKRLLKAGMSVSTAHRMINSILRVKGWEESFATVDLLKLDLCGGSAEFLKSGAAASYICRDGSLMTVGGQAFPVGILADCIPDISNIKVFDGDIIIMMSDGTDEGDIRKVLHILERDPRADAKDIALKLGEDILSEKVKKQDDITIIVSKISVNIEEY